MSFKPHIAFLKRKREQNMIRRVAQRRPDESASMRKLVLKKEVEWMTSWTFKPKNTINYLCKFFWLYRSLLFESKCWQKCLYNRGDRRHSLLRLSSAACNFLSATKNDKWRLEHGLNQICFVLRGCCSKHLTLEISNPKKSYNTKNDSNTSQRTISMWTTQQATGQSRKRKQKIQQEAGSSKSYWGAAELTKELRRE